jgi:RNA-binding protein 39
MFDPAEETERDWDIELREDVKAECEEKYGRVVDIHVAKESAVGCGHSLASSRQSADILLRYQGEIYIRFDSIDASTKGVNGLNGRWL